MIFSVEKQENFNDYNMANNNLRRGIELETELEERNLTHATS